MIVQSGLIGGPKLNVYEICRRNYEKLGYTFFEGDNFDLNILGVRNVDRTVNRWNDALIICYKDDKKVKSSLVVLGTVDPGLTYNLRPLNPSGTGYVKPGQYPGLWKLGLHHGKIPALVQNAPVTVWRDTQPDADHDEDKGFYESGMFAINFHPPYTDGLAVIGAASAACWVTKETEDYAEVLHLAQQQSHYHGSTFTGTLFDGKTNPEMQLLVDCITGALPLQRT